MKPEEMLDVIGYDLLGKVIGYIPLDVTVQTIRDRSLIIYKGWSRELEIPPRWPVMWYGEYERYHPVKHLRAHHLWGLCQREIVERFEQVFDEQYEGEPSNFSFTKATKKPRQVYIDMYYGLEYFGYG